MDGQGAVGADSLEVVVVTGPAGLETGLGLEIVG